MPAKPKHGKDAPQTSGLGLSRDKQQMTSLKVKQAKKTSRGK
jgi:hypothetical protein